MLTHLSAKVPMPKPLPDGDYSEDFKASGATFQIDSDDPTFGHLHSTPIPVQEAKVINGQLVVSGWVNLAGART